MPSSPPSCTPILWAWGYGLLVLMLAVSWVMAGLRPMPRQTIAIAQPTGYRIPINQASEAELALLPGIGPALAGRLVQHRQLKGPFVRPQDVMLVPGIGPVLHRRLSPWITLDEPRLSQSESPRSEIGSDVTGEGWVTIPAP